MKKGFEQVADKYKVVDIDNLLKIKESINRDEDPKCLILEGIYGSEIIYKEEMQDGDEDINPRMYSLNKGSYLINYLDINLQGSNIYLLRKYNTWKHKYSCFENFGRNLGWYSITYGFFRPIIQYFGHYLEKKWSGEAQPHTEENRVTNGLLILAEISIVLGFTIFQSYKCIKAMRNFRKDVNSNNI